MISAPESLPVFNIPVVRLDLELTGDIDPAAVESAIEKALARLDVEEGSTSVALAFKWQGEPSHGRMHALATGICQGFAKTVANGEQMILVMEGDIGKSLGVILRNEMNVTGDVISLDGIQLREFDYIDIGELIQPTDVAPLIIKSLLFSSNEPANTHSHDHDHPHHDHHHHD